MTAREVYENCDKEYVINDLANIEIMLDKYVGNCCELTAAEYDLMDEYEWPNFVLCQLGLGDHEAICYTDEELGEDYMCSQCPFDDIDGIRECAFNIANYLLELIRKHRRTSIDDLI